MQKGAILGENFEIKTHVRLRHLTLTADTIDRKAHWIK